jgi:DNA-binding transcriptional MerR regulator
LLIRDAKSVGFTISEIGQLMDAWYNNKMTVDEKIAVLDEKLLSIDERIKQLKDMKKLLSQFKEDVMEENC